MKGGVLARDFYPFVEESATVTREQTPSETQSVDEVNYPARIAIYDDAAAAPRVVVVEPSDPRSYLEEITATVNKLAHEQGGSIPFTVIREIVENFIHAYFIAPTISILDTGNTIRFSDQGPGIKEKTRALEYGTSSATEEMKHYIRGVGSGLPYAQQYMLDKGGSLEIEDNISSGTVVTISTHPSNEVKSFTRASAETATEPAPVTSPLNQAQPTLAANQTATPQSSRSSVSEDNSSWAISRAMRQSGRRTSHTPTDTRIRPGRVSSELSARWDCSRSSARNTASSNKTSVLFDTNDGKEGPKHLFP